MDLGAAIEIPRVSSQPAYRPDLPAHNPRHIYEETLPEGLRLVTRDGKNNTARNRLVVAVSLITHDMWSHLPLDPAEGFATKEERTVALARPLILGFLNVTDTDEVSENILSTSVPQRGKEDTPLTPNQRKVRRADISNVGSYLTSLFLSKTVNLFHEEIILNREAGKKPTLWMPFLDRQYQALTGLLRQDLSLSTEAVTNGKGAFNKRAEKNASLIGSKTTVRNPKSFVSRYGQYIKPLVPAFQEIVPYILSQGA